MSSANTANSSESKHGITWPHQLQTPGDYMCQGEAIWKHSLGNLSEPDSAAVHGLDASDFQAANVHIDMAM